MECSSSSYRTPLEFQGGSFAAALHDALRIFMVRSQSGPKSDLILLRMICCGRFCAAGSGWRLPISGTGSAPVPDV